MNEQLLGTLLEIAGVVAAILLFFAKSKLTDLIASSVKSVKTRSAVLHANDVIFATVREMQQTAVRHLKKSLEDGKVTREEYEDGLKEIRKNAVHKITTELLHVLKDAFGFVGYNESAEWVKTRVEAAVHVVKAESLAVGRTSSIKTRPPV